MVFAISQDEGSARRGARSPDSLLPASLGESLRAMAGKHSRLVHQPADLVGSPDPGVVSGRRNRRPTRISRLGLAAGPRHARYLVLVVALGLRDDGRRDAPQVLS